MKVDLYTIRDVTADDVPFIMSTWLKGLKFGNSWFKLINDKIFFQVYHAFLQNLLIKPDTTIKIACLKSDPDVILGYAVYTGDHLHWVHVKKAWRNIGIARDLVPPFITFVTHLSQVGKTIFLKKKTWEFNPFAFN